MAGKTRLGLDAYGVRPAGDFSGKASGVSPVPITRLALDAYGARRAGSFFGKTPSVGAVARQITRQHSIAGKMDIGI